MVNKVQILRLSVTFTYMLKFFERHQSVISFTTRHTLNSRVDYAFQRCIVTNLRQKTKRKYQHNEDDDSQQTLTQPFRKNPLSIIESSIRTYIPGKFFLIFYKNNWYGIIFKTMDQIKVHYSTNIFPGMPITRKETRNHDHLIPGGHDIL